MKAVTVAAQDKCKVWHLLAKALRGLSTNEQ